MRMHPELQRLRDEKDRQWAIWMGEESMTPAQRLAAPITIFVIGPLVVTVSFLLYGLHVQWLSLKASWPLVILAGLMGGWMLGAIAIEVARGRSLKQRYFEAMRIFGHDVCPECGYDMAGHIVVEHTLRTCPECGCAVKPLLEVRE